jgi:general secretion pathway protein D
VTSSRLLGLTSVAVLVAACANPAPPPSSQHLEPAPATKGKAPDFAVAVPLPKPPKPSAKPELYSVVVHDMPVQDLLFALARDAQVNVSVHPAITGKVTMSALDQTLTEILDTVSKQVDMRYEINGKSLSITPDAPYLKIYRIDYPNIARNAQSSVSISTNVASTGGGTGSGSGSNASDTTVKNTANNLFWETIVANLRDILRETDKLVADSTTGTAAPATPATTTPSIPAAVAAISTLGRSTTGATTPAGTTTGTSTNRPATGTTATATTPQTTPATLATTPQGTATAIPATYRETAYVIANPENGVINVRATQRQHEKVREFLDGIMENARRQVLIEATIVEVDLSDRYQQGIDWSLLRAAGSGSTVGSGLNVGTRTPDITALGATYPTAGSNLLSNSIPGSLATITYVKQTSSYTLASALRLLESFGTLRVLSSPKLSVLNSQTSILKVVDNEVYFTITVTPGTAAVPGVSAATPATYTSTINTVPIGFLMTVTPQISRQGEVILNLRPTISRISRYATDPNPDLARNGVINQIPVVQSREMESILRVQSGDVAVLGGLIQDTRDRKVDGIPGLNGVPVVGDLFSYKDNKSRKTELVIFLRPTVLSDASLDGDFKDFRSILPEARASFNSSSDPGQPVPERP